MGTGRLCVYVGRSSFGVSFVLKVLLMPMSSLCRAKLSWFSTKVCSSSFLPFPWMWDPSHWIMVRNFCLDSVSLVGSSSSLLMSSRISFNIPRYMDVCSASFLGFSGVGNQKFSSISSCSLDFMSSLTYMM